MKWPGPDDFLVAMATVMPYILIPPFCDIRMYLQHSQYSGNSIMKTHLALGSDTTPGERSNVRSLMEPETSGPFKPNMSDANPFHTEYCSSSLF